MTTNSTEAYLAELQKRLGKRSVHRASDRAPRGEVTHVLPSGIEVLDKYILGCGGYPCRRMIEIYAAEGTGKSSLLFAAFAEAQKAGAITHYYETENRLNRQRLQAFGVDLDELVIDEPRCLEDLLEHMEAALDSLPKDTPALFGWDSFAATPSKAEIEEGLTGKAAVADRARVMSRTIRVLAAKVAEKNVALLIINQIRANIGVMFGEKETPPGGNALRYYASIRISLMGGQALKKGPYHIGKAPVATLVKSLFVPPWRKARIYLTFADGWSNDRTLLELGRDMEIVEESAKLSRDNVDKIRKELDRVKWDPLQIGRKEESDKEASTETKKVGKKKAAKK